MVTLRVSHDVAQLVNLLADADESAEQVRRQIENPAHSAYVVQHESSTIGAVLMHWQDTSCEIVYIAIHADKRGQGYGKATLQAIVNMARQRNMHTVDVGTSNASLDQLAFYQKAGFRLHAIRHDYFAYLPTPAYENGIRLYDMIVLRYHIV